VVAALVAVPLFSVGVVVSAGGPVGPASATPTQTDPALATCPASRPISSLPVFVQTEATRIPDDLTVDANGNVWVTVEAQGHILEYSPDGSLRQDLSDPNGPEGIIVTPGVTVVADQLASRVDKLNPDGQIVPFLKLPNRHNRLPVDGLGFDNRRQRLLVPNSPEGTLLTTPLGRASPRLLATGLGRPVAAAVGQDGFIYIAAESRVGLWRMPANGGTPRRVGRLSNLDEVVSDGRLLYTTGAGDGTVQAVDPVTGASTVLVTGGHQLQGLAALPDGRLLVISSQTRAISFVSPCSG
jgi:streptogramin lyase